jgi:hypothetical protein
MSRDRLSPKVLLSQDAALVPLQASNYNPTLTIVVFEAIAVFAAVVAFAAGDIGFRLVMGSLAVLMAAAGPIALSWTESVAGRVVQIDSSARGLRFVPSVRPRVLFFVLAAVGLVPGVVALVFALAGVSSSTSSGIGRWGPYVVGILALGWLVQQLWALRIPLGLTLTEQGLRGVRGTARIDLSWGDLTEITVVAERGAKLVVVTTGDSRMVVEPRWTGSDPNVVAAIATHFLQHPADRPLLADPRAAVRRVEEVLAQS